MLFDTNATDRVLTKVVMDYTHVTTATTHNAYHDK